MDKTMNENESTMYYIIVNNRGKAIHEQFPIKHLEHLCDILSLHNRNSHSDYIAVWSVFYNPDNWLDSRIKKLTSILDILGVDYELAKRC